ncbi:hypothetical protein Tco_1005694 [Tanacetum coccineum]|uniref:Uncharacterized protein n=1 Tax=Tanacetum coccineum TaxID=301880 RepID=A0ABQ5FG18_9ASTR
MATLIVSISSDSSEDSVGSSSSRVVMFGMIPTVIHADVSTVRPTVLEVTTTIVASPTEASDDFSGSDSFESLPLLDSHEIVFACWRGKVASRPVSSSTYVLPSTNVASPTPHQIIPAPHGVPRRPAILVLPGQEIPFGRPYRTYPDRILRMLTASKRVHPFLASIPTNRRRFHSSSSSPRKRHMESSYSSSSDSPPSTVDDSPAPHRFVDPYPVRTPRDNETYRHWRAAPLSIVYPSTTFESSYRDFSSDSSTSSSKRPPYPSATHSLTPSPSVGPSRKRCRSSNTSIWGRRRGRGEAESSARGIVEIGVDRVIEPDIPVDSLVPASDRGSREDFEIGLDVVIQELYNHMEPSDPPPVETETEFEMAPLAILPANTTSLPSSPPHT